MSGRRRYTDIMIGRPIVRVFALALVCIAAGHLIALSCVIGWLRQLPGDTTAAIVLFSAAAGAQLIGATAAMIAWAWSR